MRRSPRPSLRRVDWLVAWALVLVLGCVAVRPGGLPEVSGPAAAAFAEARGHLRAAAVADTRDARRARQEEAREALERAHSLAPDWVAPRRALDDLANADLLGIVALAAHEDALRANPLQADVAYLRARLRGGDTRDFERALAIDPRLSFAHHGIAYAHARGGQLGAAIRYERRALERARDAFERTFFTQALARFYSARGDEGRAVTILEERLADAEVGPIDRVELELQLTRVELESIRGKRQLRGRQRALALLRDHDLTGAELTELVLRLRAQPAPEDPGLLEVQLALSEREHAVRDRLRAELMLEEAPSPLALGLLRRAHETEDGTPRGGHVLRAAQFAAGDFAAAVSDWVASLPASWLDRRGLPRDQRIAAVAVAARRLEEADPELRAERLEALGDALLAAGWFQEARAVARELGQSSLAQGLALEDRAAAGRNFLLGLERLMLGLEPRGAPATEENASESLRDAPRSLDDLLERIGPLAARARAVTGVSSDAEAVSRELRDSPRLVYLGLAAVVHPGVYFSRFDEHAGLGTQGRPVPGLASLMHRLGRFAIVGEHAGAPPDAAVMQSVWVEERTGVHLGVPWAGTIAWCDGADVLSQAGRLGARIGGAALHEGYWVDLDVLRDDWRRWEDLRREFEGEEGAALLDAALATRGLRVEPGEHQRHERRAARALLGAWRLVRLAVLRDRRLSDHRIAPVELDEIVQLTAAHEEGHLCDRERFLPLGKDPLGMLRIAARGGFSPRGIQRQLEYRAQLVAICVAADPRMPLSDVLAAADSEAPGITPHAAAYRILLRDFLRELDRQLEREPEAWPELDPDRMLVHQLHFLGPAKVRRVAHDLALKRGVALE